MREHGAGGAFSAIFIDVVELATIEPGVSRPCYARRLNFHVRLVCAHSPNSPVESSLRALLGGVGWGGTSASPYWAKSASAWSYFAVASACSRFASRIAALACSTASSALRFSLLVAQPRQRSLLLLRCVHPRAARRNRAPHFRCCDFHSVLFLCLPLCACQASGCFFGPRRAIPQWIATWA